MKAWHECTPVQQLERWKNVLRVLIEMTPHQRRKHFDMTTWGENTDCGTVGCAAGQCGLDPWFRRRGFGMRFDLDRTTDGDKIYRAAWTNIYPEKFFGTDGYYGIFTNDRFVFQRGSYVHRTVVVAVRKYIKELKELAR